MDKLCYIRYLKLEVRHYSMRLEFIQKHFMVMALAAI